MKLTAAVLCAALPTPSVAGTPVSPAAFEAMSTGHTLHFMLDGKHFGSEQYFSGRRSLWRYSDGSCDTGVWHAEGERVCFVYSADPTTQCWRFEREDGRIRAILDQGVEAEVSLDLSHTDDAALDCPGPEVGS